MRAEVDVEKAVGKVGPLFWWSRERNERVVVNCGGSSSSKTYSVLQLLALKALTERDLVITVVADTVPALRNGAERDFVHILSRGPMLKGAFERNKNDRIFLCKATGSIVEFKSYEDPESARGPKRQYLFINEANKIKKELFEELESRTTEKVFIDFNPSSRFWVYDLYENRPETAKWIYSNFTHNPFLHENVKRSLLAYKETNPFRWRVMGEGRLGQSEDNVYTNYELVDSWPAHVQDYYGGIDFGFTKDPTTAGRLGFSDGKIYVQCFVYSTGLLTSQLAAAIKEFEAKLGKKLEWIADPQNPETIATLAREHGLKMASFKKKPNSIKEGISLVQEYKICVVRGGHEGLMTELENYVWLHKELNQPIDKFNHALDWIRYVVTYATSTIKTESKPYYDEVEVW